MNEVYLKEIKDKDFPNGRTFYFSVRFELSVLQDNPTKPKHYGDIGEDIVTDLADERPIYQTNAFAKLHKRIHQFFIKGNQVRELRAEDTVLIYAQGRLVREETDTDTNVTDGKRNVRVYYVPELTVMTASMFRNGCCVADQSLV